MKKDTTDSEYLSINSRDVLTKKHQDFAETGFGGWADEKTKTTGEAAPMLSQKNPSTTQS